MSGHSHWSTIKRKKGAADAKKGKIFTKLSREISASAREGGGDLTSNVRLRMAVQNAKDNNMPNDNIERAVKRGTGGDGGESLIEVTYEGYAPGGAAVLIQALTDNKNRTVSEVRTLFTHNNGSLAEAGSVIWNFERKGVVVVDDSNFDTETLTLKIIDAGAEDFKEEDGIIEVYTSPEDLEQVRFAIEGEGVNITSSEASMLPKSTVPVEQKVVKQALRLLEELEDIDDVQQVFTNGDFPQDIEE
ncbi:MAG: YebC/PmpR family DNA-binding transcriptional regulator [SAR202 cluster bacterium]|nr:YebC/PmpR family DNA-binding transcriptional regulator [SAR202 cluster bacterium]|tara:strand:- start:1784 stop:2521 length:738 start_codon:yes stop_codon:yes gene_type:complete